MKNPLGSEIYLTSSNMMHSETKSELAYLKSWEICYDLCELVMIILLRELYFPSVKLPYS